MAEPIMIKIEKFGEKPLKEYVEAVASAEEKPQIGSVSALVASLAAAMGELALNLAGPEAAERVKTAAEELKQMREYMLFVVDDEIKSRGPLERRKKKPEETDQLEGAARVACGVPSEMVFVMCRNIELLDQISDECGPEGAADLMAAVYLSLAVIRCMQAQIRALTRYMTDEVFIHTVIREAEIHLEEHQPIADALLAKLQKKLEE